MDQKNKQKRKYFFPFSLTLWPPHILQNKKKRFNRNGGKFALNVDRCKCNDILVCGAYRYAILNAVTPQHLCKSRTQNRQVTMRQFWSSVSRTDLFIREFVIIPIMRFEGFADSQRKTSLIRE